MLFNKENANQAAPSTKQYKQYTGVGLFKLVAINPNKTKLEELGYKPKEEPSYFGEDYNGELIAKNTFYFQHVPTDNTSVTEEFKVKLTIKCKDIDDVSSTGKYKFTSGYAISNQLEVSYYMENGEDFYKHKEGKEWYNLPMIDINKLVAIQKGEEEMINLLTTLTSFAWSKEIVNEKGDKIKIHNNFFDLGWREMWGKVCQGDMKWFEESLKEIENENPEIYLAVYVNSGGYQEVYSSYFSRNNYLVPFQQRLNPSSPKADEYLISKASDISGEWVREYKAMSLNSGTTTTVLGSSDLII